MGEPLRNRRYARIPDEVPTSIVQARKPRNPSGMGSPSNTGARGFPATCDPNAPAEQTCLADCFGDRPDAFLH
jgi:hypothetical protein